MKPKLMVENRGMEKSLMFFFPNDNPDLNLQGCLNKNTLTLNDVNFYITILIKKEERRWYYSLLDMKGNTIYFEYSKRSPDEKLSKLPVVEYLSKLIRKEI
jgi:hypothetical protein